MDARRLFTSGGSVLRSRRVHRASAWASSGAILLSVAAAAMPARADVDPGLATSLPLPSITTFVVDRLNGHLLFGDGSRTYGLLVGTPGSSQVTALPAFAGVGVDDISITPDGQTAFVASVSAKKIYRLALSSLSVTTTYTLPAGGCPLSVAAVSSTSVAVTYACDTSPAHVGVLTTTGPTFQGETTKGYYQGMVRLIPGTTDVLVSETNDSGSDAAVFHTATGAPVQGVSTAVSGLTDCTNGINDVAVGPDGQTFAVACNVGNVVEYKVSDFSVADEYFSQWGPTSVAFSPDGSMLAAGQFGDYTDDLELFHHTSTDDSLVYSYDFTDSDTAWPIAAPRGLAFMANTGPLYAVTWDPTATSSYFLSLPVDAAPPPYSPPVVAPPVVVPPVVPRPVSAPPVVAPSAKPLVSAVNVTSPPREFVGEPFPLTGGLTFAGVPAAGVQLMVAKTVAGVRTDVGTVKTTSLGTYSYPVTLTAVGNATYSVGFLGDSGHYGASASTTIAGTRAPARVTLKVAKVKGKVYAVTAHLSSWGVNRHVLISANKKIIGNGVVNAKGYLTVRFTRKKATTFMVVFTGDRNDYPARATKGLR